MGIQHELFGHTNSDPLIGLKVQLPRGEHRHGDVCELHPGRAMHAYALKCPMCGEHRGWLPKDAVPFLKKILASFGRPTAPIVLRNVKEDAS
jgi:hypothetical protein